MQDTWNIQKFHSTYLLLLDYLFHFPGFSQPSYCGKVSFTVTFQLTWIWLVGLITIVAWTCWCLNQVPLLLLATWKHVCRDLGTRSPEDTSLAKIERKGLELVFREWYMWHVTMHMEQCLVCDTFSFCFRGRSVCSTPRTVGQHVRGSSISVDWRFLSEVSLFSSQQQTILMVSGTNTLTCQLCVVLCCVVCCLVLCGVVLCCVVSCVVLCCVV